MAVLSLGLVAIGAPVGYMASAQENEADPQPNVESTPAPTVTATPKPEWPTTSDGSGHIEIDKDGNLIFIIKEPDTNKDRSIVITVPTNGTTPDYKVNIDDFLAKIDLDVSRKIEPGNKTTYTITIPGADKGIIQIIIPPNTKPGFTFEQPGRGKYDNVKLTGDYSPEPGGGWNAHLGVKIGLR